MYAVKIPTFDVALVGYGMSNTLINTFNTNYRGYLLLVAGFDELAPWELPAALKKKRKEINGLRGKAFCVAKLTETEQIGTNYFRWKFTDISLLHNPFEVIAHPLLLDVMPFTSKEKGLRCWFCIAHPFLLDVIPPVYSELLAEQQKKFYYNNVKGL